MRINENIAYAKSILSKLGITTDSEEYSDYLKIRELCNNNPGYVGILTKLRFVDKVSDMEEISSIFDILKNSKIDINKLNKLSYEDILEMFYDEFDSDKVDKRDIELFYKDEQYSYYKVYTYKGILQIGSPSWCLKTKTNWDEYQAKYPTQWVVVDNRYKSKLISPDSNYLGSNYTNVSKPWVRYGISTSVNENGSISWTANDDGNGQTTFKPQSWTFFGVLCTVLNLCGDNKKSYFESFKGCEKLSWSENWHKVNNKKGFSEWVGVSDKFFGDEAIYVSFSKSYSMIPFILCIGETGIELVYLTKKIYGENESFNKCGILTKKGSAFKFILEEIKNGLDDEYYSGIELMTGTKTIDDIKSNKRFVTQIGDWLVFNRNDNYYLVVNTNIEDELDIPSTTLSKKNYDMKNPIAWYLEKKTMKPYKAKVEDCHQLVIDGLNKFNKVVNTDDKKDDKKKVNGFLDFLKNKLI